MIILGKSPLTVLRYFGRKQLTIMIFQNGAGFIPEEG